MTKEVISLQNEIVHTVGAVGIGPDDGKTKAKTGTAAAADKKAAAKVTASSASSAAAAAAAVKDGKVKSDAMEMAADDVRLIFDRETKKFDSHIRDLLESTFSTYDKDSNNQLTKLELGAMVKDCLTFQLAHLSDTADTLLVAARDMSVEAVLKAGLLDPEMAEVVRAKLGEQLKAQKDDACKELRQKAEGMLRDYQKIADQMYDRMDLDKEKDVSVDEFLSEYQVAFREQLDLVVSYAEIMNKAFRAARLKSKEQDKAPAPSKK